MSPKVAPEELDRSRGLVIQAKAGYIPFADRSFDLVFSTNVLEHTNESGDTFRMSFHEVHRVLKPFGKYIVDFPIHLHGHRWFVKGRLGKILSLWNPRMWDIVEIEEWRKDHFPLEPYFGWRLCKFRDSKVPNNGRGISTYMVSVVAVKKERGDFQGCSIISYNILLLIEACIIRFTLLFRLSQRFARAGLLKIQAAMRRGFVFFKG